MGPSNDQDPEAQALSQRAVQYYNSNLTQVARSAIPKSIAAQTKLQSQDINTRAAIYADMQSRAQINYHEAILQREQTLGMAIMQRDLYGSLFGGLAKVGGSVAAAAISTPSGSQQYYPQQSTVPTDSQWAEYTGANNPGFVGPPTEDDAWAQFTGAPGA
jgi:hypothetical protein